MRTPNGCDLFAPAHEAYNALERGVVGDTIFPWEAISSFKLAEVIRQTHGGRRSG